MPAVVLKPLSRMMHEQLKCLAVLTGVTASQTPSDYSTGSLSWNKLPRVCCCHHLVVQLSLVVAVLSTYS